MHPFAQTVSKLTIAVLFYIALKTYVFADGSYWPTLVLVFMVAGAFRSQQTKIAQLIMPTTITVDSVGGERQALLNAVAALDLYKERTGALLKRRYALFAKMSMKHRKIAEGAGYLDRLAELDERIANNAKIVAGLVRFAKKKHAIKDYELRAVANPVSNHSVIELLNHYVRDWSKEQATERTMLFEPLLENLSHEFPDEIRSDKRVLVPGSGLARAAYEISKLGFKTEAVEYSHLMDLAAQFVYNLPGNISLSSAQQFELFPYVHDFSHQDTREKQLRGVNIPDLGAFRKPKNLTLKYGDFTSLAKTQPGTYDSVVTLFLIDTAENVMIYLEAINALLKAGGIWINYGPLKWGTAPQAELSMEELQAVIPEFGFTIEKTWRGRNQYNGDRESLWEAAYKICGWVARKPIE